MGTVKILMVCKDDDFLDIHVGQLLRESIDVATARSPEEALNEIRVDEDLDVVIFDCQTAGPSNLDTLSEIKMINPLIEVVMLTSDPTPDPIIIGVKPREWDYLLKPVNPDRLIEKIAQAAAKKATHEEKIIQARIRELYTQTGG